MSMDKLKQEARKENYKNNKRSADWKEKFRMRCLDRLKDRRDRYLSTKRPLVIVPERALSTQELITLGRSNCAENELEMTNDCSSHDRIPELDLIMKEEFDRLKEEVSSSGTRTATDWSGQQRAGSRGDGDNDTADDQNCMEEYKTSFRAQDDRSSHFNEHERDMLHELLSWYEEVYQAVRSELEEAERTEEELCVNQYLKHEEEELCSGMRALYHEEVCCPLCQRDSLTEQKNVIQCSCGLRIHIEQDSITLKHVRDNLAVGTQEHNHRCESKPMFSLNQKFGVSNLLMSCQDCDFLFVIV